MLSQLNQVSVEQEQQTIPVTSDNNIPWWIPLLIVMGIISVLLLLVGAHG